MMGGFVDGPGMELILWRHAEAEDGLPDAARKLTRRGRRQAADMAAWLRPRLPRRTLVIASPATRTRQTAEALDRPFETDRRLGVGASAADVLGAIGWPDRAESVVVVGHQPTLGRLAALLLSGEEAEWSVRKGAVWWLSTRHREGAQQVVLRASLAPELVQVG
jgi:phosphohistidine phosphatase